MPSRRAVVSLLAAGLAGCTALRADPDPEPPGSTSYAWPSVNATPANTRTVPDGTIRNPGSDSPIEYGVDAIDIAGSYARAPVVDDGKTVLVAPAEEDDACVVTCLDTGEEQGWPAVRWQRRLEREFPDGAPAIADDRVVLTVSDETGVSAGGDGLLAALSMADGELEWSRPLERGSGFTPTVADGTVYLRTTNGIVAVDAATGEEEWSDALPTLEHPHQRHTHTEQLAPAVDSNRVYVPGEDELVVYDRDGDRQWNVSLAPPVGAPAVADGTVYCCAGGELRALEAADGSRRWTESDVVSIAPAVAEDAVVVVGPRRGKAGGTVRALEPETGTKTWDADVHFQGWGGFAPLIVGETVVVNANRRMVGLATDTGATRWETEKDDSRWHLAAADGRVYNYGDDSDGDSSRTYRLQVFGERGNS
ncbi:outer membrane protein assembly factor BamB family protein [Natronococcus pandeyae]|uniref:outer membrane protein assembly factor BamB family protein n=1 Tax=Natronococcus pandeyae TaxID=2055836 RepID=UPI0016532306|nr:PQQ-like beta-propeller repeat protein [Natronococcus pandeyae]